MIFEHDYILRLIAEMGEALRHMVEMADELDDRHELEVWARKHCAMTLEALQTQPTETIRQMTDDRQCLAASMVLSALAEHVPADEAAGLRLRAFRLLVTLKHEPGMTAAMADTMYGLVRACADDLTPEELLDAAAFLRDAGHYSHMDNTIFFLWETLTDAGKNDWRDRAMALYRPLRSLREEFLQEGGLSREDVADSCRQLCEKASE